MVVLMRVICVVRKDVDVVLLSVLLSAIVKDILLYIIRHVHLLTLVYFL
jgi:hypothetical protein